MVTTDKIKRGVANYADAEILSKIPDNGFKKVLIGTGLSLYINNLEKIIMSQKDNAMIAALGVIHPDGTVDIDRIAEAVKANIPGQGMRIDIDILGSHIADMTLHQSDIDNILYHINNA